MGGIEKPCIFRHELHELARIKTKKLVKIRAIRGRFLIPPPALHTPTGYSVQGVAVFGY